MLDQRDLFGEKLRTGVPMLDRFGIPPFSVFDARQGYWQERKRLWLSLGLDDQAGRDDTLLFDSASINDFDHYRGNDGGTTRGTSLFDPVLAEFLYRWFCPKGGDVLDPFAGGATRGIVAASLGLDYTGVDLRPEQVDANYALALAICRPETIPAYFVGDSTVLDAVLPAGYQADLVFSCPPYWNVEHYSEDPVDLSNAPTYRAFLERYAAVIRQGVRYLRQDRFAAFVVGDFRDGDMFRPFALDTVVAFAAAGADLYNQGVLLTAVGTLPIRAAFTFPRSRKLGMGHQYVLIFLKGDARAAVEAVRWPEDRDGDGPPP